MKHALDRLFEPKSVAAIGASDREGSVGYALIRNLVDGDYQGQVYAVNPGHLRVHGMKSYRSVLKIRGPVDLAVIAAPAALVPGILEECGKAEVGGVVIISAGFKEAGGQGEELYREIKKLAQKYHLPVLGPNCVGFTNGLIGLNASFAKHIPPSGQIAFISQSGALGTAIIDWAIDQNVGISKFISVGSMMSLGFHNLIDYLGSDPNTKSILIYMESLGNARRFMSAARSFARKKPIILIKAGKSAEGAKASRSHTGAMAGDDAVYRAAFKRAGIIQVETIQQLFDCAEAISMQNLPEGNRLAIVTNAGGPGVLATDYLITRGGELAHLSKESMKGLDGILPAHWSRGNPVDVLGDTGADIYLEALQICDRDPNVDGILAVFAPQAITDPDEVAQMMVESEFKKPILACWMGEGEINIARETLEQGGIPNYRYPENVVDVFLQMFRYSHRLKILYETPPNVPHVFKPDRETAGAIIDKAMKQGSPVLSELDGKRLLQCYGIPVPKGAFADNLEVLKKAARTVGYPVVLKVQSEEIAHKSDVGGVALNIQNSRQLTKAYEGMMERIGSEMPGVQVQGVQVEQMVSKQTELFIGAHKDPVFGPVIAFGSGGVLVELLKDVHLGLPPLNMALAKHLISESRVSKVLEGYRGFDLVSMEEIQFLLVKFSYLLMDFPEIREVDINPFAVDGSGGLALDAFIRLEKKVVRTPGDRYSHMVISPYPTELRKEVELKNGLLVHMRPIKPEDEPLEAELFGNLSQKTIYQRFFGYIKEVDHELLIQFTNIDYDRELAILGLVEDKGKKKIAGVVRIVSDVWTGSAEYAIVVADRWQGLGLGTALTQFIIEIARDKGVKKLTAEVMSTNQPMLHLLDSFGFKIYKHSMGVEYLELPL